MRKPLFGLTSHKDGTVTNDGLERVDDILSQITEKVDIIDSKYYLSQAYNHAYGIMHDSEFRNELSYVEVSPKEDVSIGSQFERLMRLYQVNRIYDIFKIDLFKFANSELSEIESMVRFAESVNASPEVKKAEDTVNQVQDQIKHLTRENAIGIKK